MINFTQSYKRKSQNNAKNSIAENQISYKIIGAALENHNRIDPCLLESAYESALAKKILQESIHRIANNL
jgi:hypothetical protein